MFCEKIAQKELRIKTKNIEETIRPKDIDKLSKVLSTYNFVKINISTFCFVEKCNKIVIKE